MTIDDGQVEMIEISPGVKVHPDVLPHVMWCGMRDNLQPVIVGLVVRDGVVL